MLKSPPLLDLNVSFGLLSVLASRAVCRILGVECCRCWVNSCHALIDCCASRPSFLIRPSKLTFSSIYAFCTTADSGSICCFISWIFSLSYARRITAMSVLCTLPSSILVLAVRAATLLFFLFLTNLWGPLWFWCRSSFFWSFLCFRPQLCVFYTCWMQLQSRLANYLQPNLAL